MSEVNPSQNNESETGPEQPQDPPEDSNEGLLKALKAVRAEKAEIQKKYRGIDLDEYARLKDVAAKAKEEEARRMEAEAAAKGDIESLKAQTQKAIQELKDQHAKELEGHMGYIRSISIENAGRAALEAAGGNATLLMPFIRERTKVVRSEGGFNVVVMDENGSELLTNEGKEADMDYLVKTMQNDPALSQAFPASGRSGSGLTSGGSQPSNATTQQGVLSRNRVGVFADNLDDIISGKVTLTD